MPSCIKVCNCTFTMSNTGIECIPLMEVARKLLLMPVYDSTGARNYIDLSVTLNAAYFATLIDQTDASKRLFPTPLIKNVNDTRNDPIYEDFDDGTKAFIREDIRTFKAIVTGKPGNPVLKAKLDSVRCGDMGTFIVDRTNSLICTISDDGTKAYPLRMDSESFYAKYVPPGEKSIQKVEIMFNFHPDESDGCMRIIKSNEFVSDVDLLALKGKLDVKATFSGLSTTGATVALYTNDGGTNQNPFPITGLVTADFISLTSAVASKVRNTTTPADITLTSATESTTIPGTYVLIWTPAQTTGNKMAVFAKKANRDFTLVGASLITVP